MTLSELLFSFQGRIGRQAWWFALAIFVAAQIVAGMVDWVVMGSPNSILSWIVSLVVLFASLAVSAKRWHDRDKSAWWILISLVPLIGQIWALVENGFLPGTRGPNRFGPDPLPGSAPPLG